MLPRHQLLSLQHRLMDRAKWMDFNKNKVGFVSTTNKLDGVAPLIAYLLKTSLKKVMTCDM